MKGPSLKKIVQIKVIVQVIEVIKSKLNNTSKVKAKQQTNQTAQANSDF
jgi:hypothetical protein